MATVLLVVGIVCGLHAVNALAPRKGRLLLIPSFFASWVTIELAPWWLFWQVVVGAALVAGGALEETRGWIGLGLLVLASAGLVAIILRARKTHLHLAEADEAIELDPEHSPQPFPMASVVFPFLRARRRAGVTHLRNIDFGEGHTAKGKRVRLRLDVVKPTGARPGDRRPGILQIHGGAWILGDKRQQGIPLLNHLAANGWVAINANYRLSPRVAAPEHLIDCKKAIAWWREHAEEHGGDPDFLCVTGGSAGGHLAALVALTADDPRYQPGFEDVDTSVEAAVPFYGVYDFTNRGRHWHKDTVRLFIEPRVMQKRLADHPEAFADYSPIDQVRPDAPPFFVIHGSLDTLAPVEDAREFVRRLREVGEAPVLYAEMAGAQHAFEIFPSFRAAKVIEAVERFLHSVHVAYRRGRGAPSEAVAADQLVEN
jgi:acetyl esterase/lipase